MQDGSAEQRRYPRFPAAIECTLKLRDGTRKLVTANVSRHGAFLRTDEPRPERELIQIRFDTPETAVEAMCMVVRAFPAAAPSPAGPGMGVDFFAISREAKNLWDAFIQDCRSRGFGPGVRPDGRPIDDTKVDELIEIDEADEVIEIDGHNEIVARKEDGDAGRKNLHQHACFLVQMSSKEQMRDFLSVDINQGGMFLRTPLLRVRGETVDLLIVHPESGEEFHINGKVVRVTEHEDGSRRGLGIRFERLSGRKLQALTDFIETGHNSLDAERGLDKDEYSHLQRATERTPESAAAHLDLGLYLVEHGQPSKAIVALNKAVTIAPDRPAIHNALARAYEATDDGRRATAHRRVAHALDALTI